MNFKDISLYKPGRIFTFFKNLYKARPSFYRMLFIVAGFSIGSNLVSGYLFEPEILMSVTDYLQNSTIKEHEVFEVYGVIKPSSLKTNNYNTNYRFILTDFLNELDVIYKGVNSLVFKEGDNCVLTGYFNNIDEKHKIIAINYQNNHNMEQEKWEGKTGVKLNDS